MKKVIVYQWPMSQLCMDCKNSSEEILDNSAKICEVACSDSDGVSCPEFEELDNTGGNDNV